MKRLRPWPLLLPLAAGLAALWYALPRAQGPDAEPAAAPSRVAGSPAAPAGPDPDLRTPLAGRSEAPAPSAAQSFDEGPRWLPALPYREGEGRSGLELFGDWWGAESERAGVTREALPKGRFEGWLGDEVACLDLWRKELPQRFASERGGATLAELRRFPGSSGVATPEALLEALLAASAGDASADLASFDRSDPAWGELVQEVARLQADLDARCELLFERMAAVLREDLEACSPTRLPPLGQLNFGPLAVGPTPAAAARQPRNPRAAWTTTLEAAPAGSGSPCRIYALHYRLFWEDVPEIAAEIEALLAHKDSLPALLAPRLHLLPR